MCVTGGYKLYLTLSSVTTDKTAQMDRMKVSVCTKSVLRNNAATSSVSGTTSGVMACDTVLTALMKNVPSFSD